jgi:hypothetical protein
MFTKFYLISSLLIGTSAVLAMDEGFIYSFSDDENSNPQSTHHSIMPSPVSKIGFARNESDSLESGSTSAASESDSDEERRRSQKSMFPSPFYKDTPEGKNRRFKTREEQCRSVERAIRSGSLLGDFIEAEEKAGKTKKRIFESSEEGVTTTITFTSYDNSEKNVSSSKKKAKLLEPSNDQLKIDGFTARNVDESQKRSSFPSTAPKKLVKSKGKGSRKSFPPSDTRQKKIDFFL